MKKTMVLICIALVFMLIPSTAYPIELAKGLDLGGWMGTSYSWSEDTAVNDRFDVRYAWLNLIGDLGDGYSYVIGVDLANSTDVLRDAWIKHSGLPFNITVGQFVAPFSAAVLTAPPKWPTIELPVNGSLVPIYDMGFMVDSKIFENTFYYALAVINGSGGNTDDNNRAKDVVGRIVISANENLSYGLAAQTGVQPLSGSYEGQRSRYDLMFSCKNGDLGMLGEYILQDRQKSGASDEFSYSWHLTGTYLFTSALQGVLQYSQYDPDQGTAGDKQDIVTLGCNIYLNERCTLQTNYRILNEEPSSQTANNQFLFHLIVTI